MEYKTFEKAFFSSEKAKFSDELELKMCGELLEKIPEKMREEFLYSLKFLETKYNPAGFYGLREVSKILANLLSKNAEARAKKAKLENYTKSEESESWLLKRYFLMQALKNYPAWFLEFVLNSEDV